MFSRQVLFVGTAVYNGSLKLPYLAYGEDYSALHEPSTPGMRVPPSMATPSLMKSPLLRRVSQEYESPAGALTQAVRVRKSTGYLLESGRGPARPAGPRPRRRTPCRA